MNDDVFNKQIGGNHYLDFEIQPAYFSEVNELSFLQGCIVKRICRYNKPGGKGKEDLEKIKHEVEILIELLAEKTLKKLVNM